MKIKRFNESIELINEATSEHFKYPNEPNEKIEKAKEWVRNNPRLARRKAEESDFFKIEVFGYNHKKQADDLYRVLKDSGYLDTHPLFSIKIEPMD